METMLLWINYTSEVDKYLEEGWNIKQIATDGKLHGCYVVLERSKTKED